MYLDKVWKSKKKKSFLDQILYPSIKIENHLFNSLDKVVRPSPKWSDQVWFWFLKCQDEWSEGIRYPAFLLRPVLRLCPTTILLLGEVGMSVELRVHGMQSVEFWYQNDEELLALLVLIFETMVQTNCFHHTTLSDTRSSRLTLAEARLVSIRNIER